MKNLFAYNWQVRDEWFEWCNQLSPEELLKERQGGVGSFLYTLFHIIDVEYSWIRGIQREKDRIFDFSDYQTLEQVKKLSDELRIDNIEFLKVNEGFNNGIVKVAWDDKEYRKIDIIHHIIVHEIHHIGQLSVWAKELALPSVSANFIGRELKTYIQQEKR